MDGIDADFLAVIGTTAVTTANSPFDGTGSYTTNDKFFLPAVKELYGGNAISGIDEGPIFPYYKDFSDLSAAGTGADTNRIKIRGTTATTWRTRSPLSGTPNVAQYVSATGAITAVSSAISAFSIAPVCNIV